MQRPDEALRLPPNAPAHRPPNGSVEPTMTEPKPAAPKPERPAAPTIAAAPPTPRERPPAPASPAAILEFERALNKQIAEILNVRAVAT